MFLSLSHPANKGVSIFVYNLVPEDDFSPCKPSYNFDSERFVANDAIREANENLGQDIGKGRKAFDLFHQFNNEHTTGHEYWSSDYKLVLRHALLVSETLKLPLNIDSAVMTKLMDLVIDGHISFDFEDSVFEGEAHGDMVYIKQGVDTGLYFVLKNLQLT